MGSDVTCIVEVREGEGAIKLKLYGDGLRTNDTKIRIKHLKIKI